MVKIKRKMIQILTAIVSNSYFKGFKEGIIYKGNLKNFCVPGLNCYSCPGALGSCPIGSLQAVLSDIKYKFSFYVIGFLLFIGISLGRFVCGWLCPFGLIQELLHKIPSPKIKIINKLSHLKYLKYMILIVFVIFLPLFWVNDFGIGAPTFCKYICPAGTLEGGIPLILFNSSLQESIGFLFYWKFSLLILTIFLSIFIFRPFCRFICPLGAIYGLLNPISIYKLHIDYHKCTKCGLCRNNCKLYIDILKNPNHPECIRCGECIDACPQRAISSKITL